MSNNFAASVYKYEYLDEIVDIRLRYRTRGALLSAISYFSGCEDDISHAVINKLKALLIRADEINAWSEVIRTDLSSAQVQILKGVSHSELPQVLFSLPRASMLLEMILITKRPDCTLIGVPQSGAYNFYVVEEAHTEIVDSTLSLIRIYTEEGAIHWEHGNMHYQLDVEVFTSIACCMIYANKHNAFTSSGAETAKANLAIRGYSPTSGPGHANATLFVACTKKGNAHKKSMIGDFTGVKISLPDLDPWNLLAGNAIQGKADIEIDSSQFFNKADFGFVDSPYVSPEYREMAVKQVLTAITPLIEKRRFISVPAKSYTALDKGQNLSNLNNSAVIELK